MYSRRWISLLFALGISLFLGIPAALAADDGAEDKPAAVTTANPEMPVEELALLLKAFTKDELLVEADGWLGLLREKAAQIATAEIAVKRQNRAIETAKEITEKAQEARDQLAELEEKAREAEATGEAEAMEETAEALDAARETAAEIEETVEEAAEAAKEMAATKEREDRRVREVVDETVDAAERVDASLEAVKDTVEGAAAGDPDAVRQAAEEAVAASAEAEEATGLLEEKVGEAVERTDEAAAVKAKALDEAAEEQEQAADEGHEAKVVLLETVNRLREERTALIDNLKAVIAELESKTDKEDSDTLAKIRDYRLYMSSVQGIQVDIEDATSTWIAVKGWLMSEEGGIRWGKNIGKFIGILLIAWFVSKLISRAVHRALGMTDKVSRLLGDFLVGMVRWVAMAVGVIMALAALEVSVGPLMALIGAAGFIIALAMQDSLSNFASGIMILAFRPFDVGDVVDAGGVSGSVTSMNLVSTTIKTFDNKKMVVPNNKIWRDVITNATGVATRRVDMEFGIGYDDDIDKAQAILEEVVHAHPMVLADPEPTIRMNTLADSSVNFICRPWSRTEDYWAVYWDVTKEVKKRFDAAGIGIPYPQRDVHLYLEESAAAKALSGVRARPRTDEGAGPQPYELADDREPGPEAS